MASPTPGPWTVRTNVNDDWGIVRAADGVTVADAGVFTRCADFRDAKDGTLTNAQWEDGPPEVAANARLIAAAPDLLAACKVALDACQKNIAMWAYKDEPALLAAINALRPAIASAEGE